MEESPERRLRGWQCPMGLVPQEPYKQLGGALGAVRMPWVPRAMARLVAPALSVVLPWDVLVNEGH